MKRSLYVIGILVAFVAGFIFSKVSFTTRVGAVDCNTTTCFTSVGITPGPLALDGTFLLNGAMLASSTVTTGGNLATTTSGNTVFTASDFGHSTITMTPIVSAMTATLPASTSLTTFLPNAGDRRCLNIDNGTSTAAATITLAGGTGSLVRNATSTLVIGAGKNANLCIFRRSNTDLIFDIDVFI